MDAGFDFNMMADLFAEQRDAEMAALVAGWTPEQLEKARNTAKEWSGSRLRTWTDPLAVRYGSDWEFYIQSLHVRFHIEPDEIRNLRPLCNKEA